jgi:hypothetical protein
MNGVADAERSGADENELVMAIYARNLTGEC